jgi:hypothetical protein
MNETSCSRTKAHRPPADGSSQLPPPDCRGARPPARSARSRGIGVRFGLPVILALVAVWAGASSPASAEDAVYKLTLRDHKFEPATVEVTANAKFKLSITNAQKEPAEFESHELNREKVIPPGATVSVNIGPLKPGTYKFMDDFHQQATGSIVAK